jgi:hypothetical protein
MDVDFLKAHSKKQKHVIFVDTGSRDKTVWPSPAEFSLDFNTPINYVVNVNILDASIPASTYAVDLHNNTLCMLHRSGGASADPGQFTTGFLDVYRAHPVVIACFDDHRPSASVINAANNRDAVALLLRLYSNPTVTPTLTAAPQLPDDVTALAQAQAPLLLPPEDGIASAVPWTPALDAATATSPPDPALHFASDTRALISLQDGRVAAFDPALFWDAGRPDAAELPRAYHVQQTQAGGLFLVRTTAGFAPAAASGHEHEVAFHNLTVEPGEYDIKGLVEALNYFAPYQGQDPARRLFTMGSSSQQSNSQSSGFMRYNKQLQFDFTAPAVLNMRKSTINDVLGFSQPARDDAAGLYARATCNPGNAYLFQAVKPDPMANVYGLVAPGVINLTTSRFIIMRCPEIEDRFPALATGSQATGIGLFKLYDLAISHLRFDFINFVKLDFHPIGRLQRLHFRFERSDGSLYDFKGVDFHVLMSFDFLQPVKRSAGADYVSPLNPSYDPDVLQYIVNRDAPARRRNAADSGEHDDLLNDPDHRRRFLVARNRVRNSVDVREEEPESGPAQHPQSDGFTDDSDYSGDDTDDSGYSGYTASEGGMGAWRGRR